MTDTKAKILIVDDEEKNVKLMEAILRPRGYQIVKAFNGVEALEKVGDESPDLILLDVMMPVMNGFDVCEKLKDDVDTRLIPIVIMTALGEVDDRIRGIEAGADDFLTKPINREELLARIQTSLRLKKTVDHKVDKLTGAQDYLARFVPRLVKQKIEENPESPQLEKSDQDMSVLFVDVSGYTKLSEDMRQTADFVVEKYFSRFLDCIHDHDGDVTETSGDGLMVIFPNAAPKEHAVKATKAALEILQKTDDLNEQLKGIFEPISVHIGINSGVALIGLTKLEGTSGTRWTYTALGPVINLAARIAEVAEGGTILVGPETAQRVEEQFSTKEIGKKQLKNVRDEVMIYQVVGIAGDSKLSK
jgi:DNA-binding response OmpR family regulator